MYEYRVYYRYQGMNLELEFNKKRSTQWASEAAKEAIIEHNNFGIWDKFSIFKIERKSDGAWLYE